MQCKGIVYLIGAGPGDPKLLTIRGRECLHRADIIVYDYLANPRLLAEAKPEAKNIYVGKRASDHSVEQDEINKLLIDEARKGKIVARLKGGDAFIFGRGGEEASALAQNNVPFEVVPGVSSAYAAPAYAGIPVTFRGLASDVSVITGREGHVKDGPGIAWDMLAKGVGTLVFLMGIKNLPKIVRELTANGKPGTTPIAVIRWGTLADQKTLTGTLDDIVNKIRQEDFHPPAVIVVGEVVKLREQLAWFEKKPLFGLRIIVTRAAAQAGVLGELLEEAGAEVVGLPTIEIQPVDDYSIIDGAIEKLAAKAADVGFDWTIFTSANSVDFFNQRLQNLNRDVRVLAKTKIAAVGSSTAARLAANNLIPNMVPQDFRAEGLIALLEKQGMRGKNILIPRALEAREILPKSLAELGADVTVAPLYKNVPARPPVDKIIKQLKEGAIDIITFTSGSTVRNFMSLMSDNGCDRDSLAKPKIAVIGPVTAEAAKEAGLKADIMPKHSTIPELVAQILASTGAKENDG